MRIVQDGSTLDIDTRLHKELTALPPVILLEGNPMFVAIARRLLPETVREDEHGENINVTSLEAHTSEILTALLEEYPVPENRVLFSTIPEEALRRLAQKFSISTMPVVPTPAREMLDRIATAQPQTYLSLARSLQRLDPYIRKSSGIPK